MISTTEPTASTLYNQGRKPFKKEHRLPPEYEQELDRFMLRHGAKSASTRRIYRHGAALFCAFLKERWAAPEVERINREHAQTFQDFLLHESGYSRSSIASAVIAARLFCRCLVDGDVIANDPFAKLERIASPAAPDVKIVSVAEVQAMVDAAKRDRSVWGARDVALICALYSGGFRQQELLNIWRNDIDWARCTVSVRRGKGGAPRTVGLDHNAMTALEKYDRKRARYVAGLRPFRRAALEHAPIWLSARGGALSPSGLLRALQMRAREAGVGTHVYPHALRHAAATHDADAGIGDMELRDKFGWSPRSAMPYRYTRATLRARTIERSQRLGASGALKV